MHPPAARLATIVAAFALWAGAPGPLVAGADDPVGVYEPPDDFIAETFSGAPPAPRFLWLTGDRKAAVREILGHDYAVLRVRYWARDGRSAWVLEKIGKEEPITTGFVVGPDGIERVAVLIYRETRGYEVRYPFFTDQFRDARLRPDMSLDRTIDGISGATLSVNALTRLARLALYFHREAVRNEKGAE